MAGKVCGPTQEEECSRRAGPSGLDYLCRICPKVHKGGWVKLEGISPYTWHILRLRRLIRGGYRFRADDLPLEVWEDLGLADEVFEEHERALCLQQRLIP